MKRSKIKELPNKSPDALKKELSDLYMEVKKKTLEEKTGKLKNVSLLRNIKKDIARILTVIKMKELNIK